MLPLIVKLKFLIPSLIKLTFVFALIVIPFASNPPDLAQIHGACLDVDEVHDENIIGLLALVEVKHIDTSILDTFFHITSVLKLFK